MLFKLRDLLYLIIIYSWCFDHFFVISLMEKIRNLTSIRNKNFIFKYLHRKKIGFVKKVARKNRATESSTH